MKSLIYLSIFITAASAGILPPAQEPDIEGRITNGEVAKRGQFPYQVGLSIDRGVHSFWCGGSIISDRWILSAAHCAVDADGITVYFGAHNIKKDVEKGQQRIYCSKSQIYVHKGYNPKVGMDNDISLIKSPVPIEFNNLIQPVTLPKKNETYPTYEGEIVVASGWGKVSDNSSTISPKLRYIEVPIMKQTTCGKYYPGSITHNMICIRTPEKKSTCNGDSGGPLVYRDEGVNYLIGATSFGIIFGCESGWPGVFVRITSYLDWIEQISGVVNK